MSEQKALRPPCMDCRQYGCPMDEPDRTHNRARRHCDCHGPYRASDVQFMATHAFRGGRFGRCTVCDEHAEAAHHAAQARKETR